jgi:regulator of RNase E activity RraA
MTSDGPCGPVIHDPATLRALEELDAATVYNILKGLGRADPSGYSGPELRALFPMEQPVVGYAVTSAWTAGDPSAANLDYLAYLELMESLPAPRIAVLTDVSARPGRSGIAGDGMLGEFQALGCAAAVVGGSVMDIAGIARLGLPVLASGIVPAYDELRMVAFGEPVAVGPLDVATGDLLIVDRGGAVRIPADAAEAVVAGVPGFMALERSMQAMVREPGLTAARMRAWYERNEPEFLGGDEGSSATLQRVVGAAEEPRG